MNSTTSDLLQREAEDWQITNNGIVLDILTELFFLNNFFHSILI